MTAKIFIDGAVGTTGLEIRERLAARSDLMVVALPDAARERYHYEDAMTLHALTRVTDGEGRARGVYAYDASGRAVASARGGGVEAITLAYRDLVGFEPVGEM